MLPSDAGHGPTKQRRALIYFPGLLFACLLLGTLFVNIGPDNVSPVDMLLVLITVLYVPLVIGIDNLRFQQFFRFVGLPFLGYLVVGGVLIVLTDVSPLQWLKDGFSFLYFFVGLALLLKVRRAPSLAPPFFALAVALLLLAAAVVSQGGDRGTGFLPNPNLTGMWFTGAAMTMLISGRPRPLIVRVPLIGVAVYGILQTSSFGATSAFVAGAIFWAVSRRSKSLLVDIAATGVAVVIGLLALPFVEPFMRLGTEGIEGRSAGSADERFLIWREAIQVWKSHPFGVGPGGFEGHSTSFGVVVQETHNDLLGVLVDYGVIGLVLFGFGAVALFLLSARARPLVVSMAVMSFSHSTLNFRNSWIFLALLVAWDYWQNDAPDGHDVSTEGDHDPPRDVPVRRDSDARLIAVD